MVTKKARCKKKNNKETDQLPETKKQKVEAEKTQGDLGNFVVESFECFKYVFFLQQVIEEVNLKAEQEEKK